MSIQVVAGATLKCSFGLSPSTLVVTPQNRTLVGGAPAANTMDFKANVNILPFGMCTSIANPQVAAATSAAMGVLTPQPCIPMTVSPWTPGASTAQVGSMPALNNASSCMCTWAGVVTVMAPGQTTTMVP